jgi:hypothetical protein
MFFIPLKAFSYFLSISGAAVRVMTKLSFGECPEQIFLSMHVGLYILPFHTETDASALSLLCCFSHVLNTVCWELATKIGFRKMSLTSLPVFFLR